MQNFLTMESSRLRVFKQLFQPFHTSIVLPHYLPGGGGYSVQKTLWECAANMGSKISLLVYEWSLIKCKILYTDGLIFQNCPKFESKLAQM